MTELDKT